MRPNVFRNKLLTATVLSTVLFPISALAVTQQPGVIDRPVPEVKVPKNYSIGTKQAAPLEAAPSVEKVVGQNEVVANIRQVKFSGASVVSEDELQDAAASYLNRSLTKQDVANLKYDLTKLFYDRGYILVKVTTPPQDLSKGVMEVKIYEAQVGEVRVKNEGVVSPWVVSGATSRVATGDVFHEKAVESMISDINDLGGVAASVALAPGKQFGQTDLNVNLTETDDDTNYVSVDNYGSPLTGRTVGTVYLEKNNLLGIGENLHASVRQSAGEGDLTSISAGTELPTGLKNTKLKLDVLHSENEIGGRLSALEASGETNSLTTALSSNLINTRNQKATVDVGVEARTHEATNDRGPIGDARDSKDDIRQAFINGSYLHRNNHGVFYGAAKVTRGIDIFDANSKGDVDATNANADPETVIFNPSLYANVFSPFSDGSFKLGLNGQMAGDELLSSDLFVLGGYGSVRGFEPAQETGENGWRYSVQYDHNVISGENYEVKAGPFVEGGHVSTKGPVDPVDSSLHSAGLGVEVVADLIQTGPTKFRFDWAHPIGDYDSPTVDNNVWYFRVSQDF